MSLFKTRPPSAFARIGYQAFFSSLIVNDFGGQVVAKQQLLRLFKFWLFLMYKLVQFCKCLNFHFLFLRPLGFFENTKFKRPHLCYLSLN